MTAAAESASPVGSRCWCCDRDFPEEHLVRLGAHPEVALCEGCARFVRRRAQAVRDGPSHSLGARGRRAVGRVRDHVIKHKWHRVPALGRVLRLVDRFLP